MNYKIFFDESNKLDQPNGIYSYYGALGITTATMYNINNTVEEINTQLKTKSEIHFVDYTSDTHFGKYFKALNYVLDQDIKVNLMIVNKEDAEKIAKQMDLTMTQLRELFYVKLPERLFYGLTRDIEVGKRVQIIIDENSEYEKIDLERKLEEQMNAHSAYRNKGYKVSDVVQASSEKSTLLQIIDVFMGIIIFLFESQYKSDTVDDDSVSKLVKSDLIYRTLIHNNNLEKFHQKISLYKWDGEDDKIKKIHISDYTGAFLIYKTRYDIQEMGKLEKLRLQNPEQDTRFYREQMGYKTRQLKTLQGYIDELNGLGRNHFFSS
ncbi:DUF3800 domain-containing protein [Kurthia sp. FSL E2-0154]|uniref:DUF3800 domain-containing protein n=1 Tax=Kurthia sp. FSL E2-0154 TaxID=2921358 RepID=UPI0030F804AB